MRCTLGEDFLQKGHEVKRYRQYKGTVGEKKF